MKTTRPAVWGSSGGVCGFCLCVCRSSGNIRELRNVIERLLILSADRITAAVTDYC